MKFLILMIIFISCSENEMDDENPFANLNEKPASLETEKKEKKTISLDQESCIYGCSYFYKILKGSKIADKNSISLNISQINSIKKECVNKCLAAYK